MTLQCTVAGRLARDRDRATEVRKIETFKAAALDKLQKTPRPPRPTNKRSITLASPVARSFSVEPETKRQCVPPCQDPYFYLRPLQLHSLDYLDENQLQKLVLSAQDMRTLDDCISQWVHTLIDSSAYPPSPERHIDMSQAALLVQYIALAAHYLGSHTYASSLLASKFGTTVAPFLCRMRSDSIPRTHAALSKPLWSFGNDVTVAFPDMSSLVRATRDCCPEVLCDLARPSINDEHTTLYDKLQDEAAYLEQCMWMARLIDSVPGQVHLVTNGLKAIARTVLALHRRQILHRWRQVVPTPEWRAFAATHAATLSKSTFLGLVLGPSSAPPSIPSPCNLDPTAHRSKWLQKYASSFNLQDAVQHLMSPAAIARMHQHGERIQLGHYVLLDEEVNPAGAQEMMDQLHTIRQDLAKHERSLSWHVWVTTTVLADLRSPAFTMVNKIERSTRDSTAAHSVHEPPPSLDTIQLRLKELATQLQHHHEASKWIGRAIEQLGHSSHLRSAAITSNDSNNEGNPNKVVQDYDEAVDSFQPPSHVAPPANNFVDLTEDDDPTPIDDISDSIATPADTGASSAMTPLSDITNNLAEPSSPTAASRPTTHPVVSDQRVYLHCSISDRRVVRQMGALFDMDAKGWYVPPGMDTTPFSRWSPQLRAVESLPEPSSPTASPPQLSTESMYFDCPYVERDQARSLGALWDAEKKLWAVPAGRDLKPFMRWTPRAPQVSADRKYLECPYPQKFLVKGLGAEWDPEAKAWFVPPGLDLARFTRWLPQPTEVPANPVACAIPSTAPRSPPPPAAQASPFKGPVVVESVTPSPQAASSKPSSHVVPLPVRKLSVMPLKRRTISHAAIMSSCERVMFNLVASVEQAMGCPKCDHAHLWTCVRCSMCKGHCTCWDGEYRTQQNLRTEQESMFAAARQRARLYKSVHGQVAPLPDYTTCVTGSNLVSTARILGMWRDSNYFGVLGVPPKANFNVVKKQYRSMVLQLHPDKSKLDTPDKVSAFMAVTKAFRAVKEQIGSSK
ncbi:hypothetical protein DYB32_000416 [Aphanomyces invadans]|uniref:J domain-containing protein n=1 Tax=Aphanomyces invadans TaxID=157072 RepID=A0A418BA42_9STRA|nr:hypothetical protein DYB32_000416 [Aphanomyces invadans]